MADRNYINILLLDVFRGPKHIWTRYKEDVTGKGGTNTVEMAI